MTARRVVGRGDLIRFYVDSPTTGDARVPTVPGQIEALSEMQARRTRVFTLAMSGMVHTINGRLFDMDRVEFTVPFGDVEIWEYRNTGTEPHPMHAHGGLGQVLSRSTTAVLPPEDRGWKDTVLVNPGEIVRVLMRLNSHPVAVGQRWTVRIAAPTGPQFYRLVKG